MHIDEIGEVLFHEEGVLLTTSKPMSGTAYEHESLQIVQALGCRVERLEADQGMSLSLIVLYCVHVGVKLRSIA